MDHSTRFIVVDGQRRIRGFYSTFDANGMASLMNDVNALRKGTKDAG
jgi:cytochrome oxidase Cu insertion factor (SCO1/SenC/PrrC family)